MEDLLQDYEVGEDEDTSIFYFHYGSLCPSEVVSKSTLTPPPSEGAGERLNIFDQKEQGIQINISSTSPVGSASPSPTGDGWEEADTPSSLEVAGERLAKERHAPTFVQTNASAAFMTPEDELEEQEKIQQYINTGNILHTLFASIHNYNEVDKAIDQMEFEGVLFDRPMTREQLRSYIEKELSIPQVHEWFSPKWQVFNECSILYFDEKKGYVRDKRPDRVIYDGKQMIVIDFKTGCELDKHKSQVLFYMKQLRDIGYKNVSGYLWYIRHNKIVEV